METLKEILVPIALGLLLVLGFGAVFAVVEMWLWNQVMPDVFGLKEITYWQALCISWLSALLVKGVASTSSKNEEHLKEVVRLQRLQENYLAEMNQSQSRQVEALDEMKSSLQDIASSLEQRR